MKEKLGVYFSKLKVFLKRPVGVITAVVVVAVLVIGGVKIFGGAENGQEFVQVKRGDIVQEVSITGRVKAAESVDLAFEKSGKVSWIGAKVGEKVLAGRVLVSLENSEAKAQLANAEASLKSQEAELDELKIGTRPEEITLQETKLNNAKMILVDYLKDAYTKSDDAIKTKTDPLFNNPQSSNPTLTSYVNNQQLKITAESQRLSMTYALTAWEELVDSLGTNSDLKSATLQTKNYLAQTKALVNNLSDAVNSLSPSASLLQATIDGWKADIYTARTNINTAIYNVSNYEAAYLVEENQLAIKMAGSTPEQIKAQEALVEQARATVDTYKSQLNKTYIFSPINGVVTDIKPQAGEIVSANSVVASVISSAEFEIEANTPEADIAKIKVGDSAAVTLDAYGSEIFFGAKIIKINPAETVIEGVATYKTTLQFDQNDERIRSGMTANVDIEANKKDGVLFIPQRSLIKKEDGSYRVLVIAEDNSMEERKVETGLRGSDGNIEITSGLQEGEEVSTAFQSK